MDATRMSVGFLGASSPRSVLRDPALGRLLLSWGCWVAADWAALIALSLVAFDAGGPVGVGLVGAVRVLPAAVLGPVVATMCDRLPRPVLLASVHTVSGVLAVGLALLTAGGAPVWALLPVVGLGALASAVLRPTVNAMLPQLVPGPRDLVSATAAYSGVEAAATVAGPMLSGVLLATLAPAATFLALTVVYAVAAVASASVRTSFQPSRVRPAAPGQSRRQFRVGIAALVGVGTRAVVGPFLAQAFMRGLLNVFVVVLVLGEAGHSGSEVSTLFIAMGLGGVAGAGLTARARVGRGGAQWFGLGISLWGVAVLFIGLVPVVPVAVVALLVLGLGNAVADTYGFSLVNRLVPGHVSGRAWGAFYSCHSLVVAAGSLLAPVLTDVLGLSGAMVTTGALLAALPVLLHRALDRVERLATASPDDVALLHRVPFLAALPLLALELIARRARRVDVAAGGVVVRQGESGQSFYTVLEGSLVVEQDGRERRRLGPADGFGEIALLDAVPRTATVTAVTACRLLEVDAGTFLGVVTGHRPSDLAAAGLVRQRRAEDAATRAQDGGS